MPTSATTTSSASSSASRPLGGAGGPRGRARAGAGSAAGSESGRGSETGRAFPSKGAPAGETFLDELTHGRTEVRGIWVAGRRQFGAEGRPRFYGLKLVAIPHNHRLHAELMNRMEKLFHEMNRHHPPFIQHQDRLIVVLGAATLKSIQESM